MTYDLELLNGGTSVEDPSMARELYGHDERSPFPSIESRRCGQRIARAALPMLHGLYRLASRMAGWA